MQCKPNYSALSQEENLETANQKTSSAQMQLYGCIRRMKRLLDFTTNEGTAKFYMETLLMAESALHKLDRRENPKVDDEGYFTPKRRISLNLIGKDNSKKETEYEK